MALEELHRRHDHARRAEAALRAVTLPERFLDGMQLAVGREPLDRRHIGAVGLDRQYRARLHGLAVDQHRAGAADARLAADMRPGQAAHVAQEVDEESAWLDIVPPSHAVHRDRDVHERASLPRKHRGTEVPRLRNYETEDVAAGLQSGGRGAEAPRLRWNESVQHEIIDRIADRHEHVLFAVQHISLRRVGDVADTRVPDWLAELGVERDE